MKFIENGSVTSPKGFLASGVRCGIRPTQTKKDLALIFAEVPCTAAAVYTKNLVKGAGQGYSYTLPVAPIVLSGSTMPNS